MKYVLIWFLFSPSLFQSGSPTLATGSASFDTESACSAARVDMTSRAENKTFLGAMADNAHIYDIRVDAKCYASQ
jgi:hypothetical protein